MSMYVYVCYDFIVLGPDDIMITFLMNRKGLECANQFYYRYVLYFFTHLFRFIICGYSITLFSTCEG